VLIVDDNQTNLEILDQLLRSAGMVVVALTKGKAVLSTLQRAIEVGDKFHLSILDIQMPGMSGYDIAREIRKWESGSPHGEDPKTAFPWWPFLL